MSAPHTRTIVTLKWGDRYGPEYVNVLNRAAREHLSPPVRFVCFTDDDQGLDESIETHPIPPIDLPPEKARTGWRKLCLFRDDLPLDGLCLFLDLDIVVTGSLDPLFTYASPDEIPIIHNWAPRRKIWFGRDPMIGNSSVFRFPANQCRSVWDRFHAEKEWALAHFQPPQTYLTHCIRDRMVFWPREWIRSFKRHCRPPFPLNYFQEPKPPNDAKIIVFHGRPDPDEAARGHHGAKPHHRTRPAPWLQELWDPTSHKPSTEPPHPPNP